MISKRTKGLTLLELVIALAVWLVLSAGVFFLWQHTSNASINLMDRQNALENARGAMDAILSNIEQSRNVRVRTNGDILDRLDFPGHLTIGSNNYYTFTFNANQRRLNFGGTNELARYIETIYITRTPTVQPYRIIHIEIHTICYVQSCNQPNCDHPIILHGSVDVRHKNVLFNP